MEHLTLIRPTHQNLKNAQKWSKVSNCLVPTLSFDLVTVVILLWTCGYTFYVKENFMEKILEFRLVTLSLFESQASDKSWILILEDYRSFSTLRKQS